MANLTLFRPKLRSGSLDRDAQDVSLHYRYLSDARRDIPEAVKRDPVARDILTKLTWSISQSQWDEVDKHYAEIDTHLGQCVCDHLRRARFRRVRASLHSCFEENDLLVVGKVTFFGRTLRYHMRIQP